MLSLARTLVDEWATREQLVPGGAITRRAVEAVAQALMQHGDGVDDAVTVTTICREQVSRVAEDGNRRDRERAREALSRWRRS